MENRRLVPKELFDKIIDLVCLRDKAIAKLIYFGAPISQSDVFSLTIDQVQFDKNQINYQSGPVTYPKDVFSDLDMIIGKRTYGFVFTGRGNKKIDPTVPYRAIKKSAKQIKEIDPNFSLKHLSNRI